MISKKNLIFFFIFGMSFKIVSNGYVLHLLLEKGHFSWVEP